MHNPKDMRHVKAAPVGLSERCLEERAAFIALGDADVWKCELTAQVACVPWVLYVT